MKHWYATFGGSHAHPLTGAPLRDCYTLVPAATYQEAHDLMIRSVFGRHWAFLYEHADLPDDGQRAAGVQRWGLREIPFIAPSPLSDVVWAAYVAINPVRPDLWVEAVSQPVELAWYRSVAQVERAAVAMAMATARRAVDSAISAHRFTTEDERRIVAAAVLTPDANDLPRSAEEEPAEAASEINDRSDEPTPATINDRLVGVTGAGLISIGAPPFGLMTRSEALRMAAWIVALADPTRGQFDQTLRAVLAT